jgi:hypothetical protein
MFQKLLKEQRIVKELLPFKIQVLFHILAIKNTSGLVAISRRMNDGQYKRMIMHTALAVSTSCLVLGILDQKIPFKTF